MKYIVYRNSLFDGDKGYGFYEREGEFNGNELKCIEDISQRFAEYDAGNPVTMAYRPLSSLWYLLSVVVWDTEAPRLSKTVFNLLMEGDEADTLFTRDWTVLSNRFRHLNDTIRTKQLDSFLGEALSNLPRLPDLRTDGDVSALPAMLTAALYAGSREDSKQVYIGSDADAFEQWNMLMHYVPPTLRKTVSVHTGLTSGKESNGILLNFAVPETLRRIKRQGFQGCLSSNKYCYLYPNGGPDRSYNSIDAQTFADAQQLMRCLGEMPCRAFVLSAIHSWEMYTSLCDAAEHGENPLLFAVKRIPGEDLEHAIHTADITTIKDFVSEVKAEVDQYPPYLLEMLRIRILRAVGSKTPIDLPETFRVILDHAENQTAQTTTSGRRRRRQNTLSVGPMFQTALCALGAFAKIAAVIAMVVGLCSLVFGFFDVTAVTEDTITKVVIEISGLADAVKLMGIVLLSMALSAIATNYVVKRKIAVKTISREDRRQT